MCVITHKTIVFVETIIRRVIILWMFDLNFKKWFSMVSQALLNWCLQVDAQLSWYSADLNMFCSLFFSVELGSVLLSDNLGKVCFSMHNWNIDRIVTLPHVVMLSTSRFYLHRLLKKMSITQFQVVHSRRFGSWVGTRVIDLSCHLWCL